MNEQLREATPKQWPFEGAVMATAPNNSAMTTPRWSMPTWKRCLDIACCLAAMPLLLVTALLVAALTLASSPGRLLFCQERVGYMGRRFRLYKFRTMHVGADHTAHQMHFTQLMESSAPMQKLDAGDPRLIAGGAFLRASGLDELPQILNVLRGDMSIVGPRPCIPYEYEQYSAAQRRRFGSVPGLTGLWQVSGKNQTTFDEMIRLDLAYLQRRSLWLDLQIIARTPRTLFRQCFPATPRRASHFARDSFSGKRPAASSAAGE